MTETFARRLYRLRTEAGLTQQQVADRVPCNKSTVSRAEHGSNVLPELARRLDQVLEAQGTLLELVSPAASVDHGAYAGPVVTVRITLPDGTTMDIPLPRRTLLGLVGASGLAATIPTAISPPPEVTLDALREELGRFVAIGRSHPADRVSALMIPYVATIDQVRSAAPAALRRDLLELGALYCEYIGWMRQEAGDLRGAWYWSDRASEWATAAGWQDMTPYILIRKSCLAWYAGDWAQSVDLAVAAGGQSRTPGMRGQAAMQEASARALAGQVNGCQHTLDRAAHWVDRWHAHPEDEPPLGPGRPDISAERHLGRMTAACWMNIGIPGDAVDVYRAELGLIPGDWTRQRAAWDARLALAYARADTPDEACAAVTRAMDGMDGITSYTGTHTLTEVADALGRWRERDEVRDITHRVRELTA